MCVIATHTGGMLRIDKDEFEDAWHENPHGGGIAALMGSTLVVRHHMKMEDLWNEYRELTPAASEVIVHMRIATHGSVSPHNCHPFAVPGHDMAIAHNGILTQLAKDVKGDESDTRAFIRLILSGLPKGWPENPSLVELVDHYLRGDRLAVLTNDTKRKVHLFGDWHTDKAGVSWSNRNHRYAFGKYGGKMHSPDWWENVDDDRWTLPASKMEGSGSRALFPDGIPWGEVEENDLIDAMVEGEKAGYCRHCYWRPCQCERVHQDCTRLWEDCECFHTGNLVEDDAGEDE